MMHSLGMLHEQSRTDRDQYVTVNLGNIIDDFESQYAIFPNSINQNYVYDLGSIMHYGSNVSRIKPRFLAHLVSQGEVLRSLSVRHFARYSSENIKGIVTKLPTYIRIGL